MKIGKIGILSGLVISFLSTGCVTRRIVVHEPAPVPAQVVVVQEPPAPQHEVIGVPPSRAHVWVPGYWEWHHNKYEWRSGHWEKRPRTTATYVEGHWEHRREGWTFVPGYWR